LEVGASRLDHKQAFGQGSEPSLLPYGPIGGFSSWKFQRESRPGSRDNPKNFTFFVDPGHLLRMIE